MATPAARQSRDARTRRRHRETRNEDVHQRRPARSLPTRRKALFALVTLLSGFGLLEGASRLFVRLTPNARWESHSQLVATLGFPGLNEILAPEDTLFWRLKPNLERHSLTGRIAQSAPLRFSVSTDDRGCRRLPTVAPPCRRIAFLGDSTTFGIGVNDDQAFPALVQERLPGVQCLNLGVPGYTAYQGRLRLEQFPFDTPPDIVVITFGFNDTATWDCRSDADHVRLVAQERSRLINHVRFITLLRQLLPARRPDGSDTDAPRPRLTDTEFADELRAIIAWCRAQRTEPVLMLWPRAGQLLNTEFLPKQLAVLRVAEEQGVRTVDLVTPFRARRDPALFADIIHASPAGCELVAATLVPVLQQLLDTPSAPASAPASQPPVDGPTPPK